MRSKAVLILALAATLVAGACSRGPSDAAITNDVKAKLFSDTQLKSATLEVTAKDGVVTLAGEVPSEAARYQAFRLAQDTQGVTRVEDKMSVAMAAAPAPVAEPEPAPEPPKPVRQSTPRRATARPAPAPAPVVEAPAPAPVASVPSQAAPAPAPAPEPVEVEIPAGTELVIRMVDSIDSETHTAGQKFAATLDAPLTVDGDTVVPAGTDVTVELLEAKSAGRMTGRSELKVEAVQMKFQGRTYHLSTSTYEQRGSSRGKNTAAKVGGGAAIGAAIGAIAGGGKGAAIGAAIGAGGGTAVQAMTKGQQIKIPSETRIEFQLDAPLEVSYIPGKTEARRR